MLPSRLLCRTGTWAVLNHPSTPLYDHGHPCWFSPDFNWGPSTTAIETGFTALVFSIFAFYDAGKILKCWSWWLLCGLYSPFWELVWNLYLLNQALSYAIWPFYQCSALRLYDSLVWLYSRHRQLDKLVAIWLKAVLYSEAKSYLLNWCIHAILT